MTDCNRLSDRMPEAALGREPWSAEEEAHLTGCAACRAEWELVETARRLGARAPAIGDEGAIAAGVLRRLAEAPPARSVGRPLWWLGGLAAAAAVALAVVTADGPEQAPPVVRTPVVTADVPSLSPAELDSLLGDADVPLAGWSMLDTPTLGDLNEDELERVLRTWEG